MKDIRQILPFLYDRAIVTIDEVIPQNTIGENIIVRAKGRISREVSRNNYAYIQKVLIKAPCELPMNLIEVCLGLERYFH